MSLAVFDNYMQFVDRVLAAKTNLPDDVDAIELESTLVSHGVVLLYGCMEQCFQQALECKCQRCTDPEVRTFALSVKSEKTGKLAMESVKGTLKRFGINHAQDLKPALEALNVTESWDSIVNQRQRIAHHGLHASVTLSELRRYYSDIRKVIGCVCKALTLTKADVATFCSLIEFPISPTPTNSSAPE